MGYIANLTVTLTTDASGDASGFTQIGNGRILRVEFVKPGSGGFATTVDFTITTDSGSLAVLSVSDVTASTAWHPRQPTHDTSGVASLYASSGEPVESDIPIFNDRIKVVVAQGGDTLVGTLNILVG